ncbi:tissue factor pathway inhibitor [Rhipicephalus sanguineus]|uniref:tissue factor pathway inhibitor n=1 Tax=Rhipicephalus sanguineus TaxID=34632 RepID=UPI001893C261|nr:tissue factor pathway inhibitor [Rhipicephalus sanguineus]
MVLWSFGLLLTAALVASNGYVKKPKCKNENPCVRWTCDKKGKNITCFEKSYYYNSSIDRCMQFSYEGCGGNENNFPSLEDCTSNCKRNTTEYDKTFIKYLKERNVTCGRSYTPANNGTSIVRYIYNNATKHCERVNVTDGDNHFPGFRYCVAVCSPQKETDPRCEKPMDAGTKPPKKWKCHHDSSNTLFCSKEKSKKK